jgi:hypothetical protein
LNIFAVADHEDVKRTRKSLYAASIFTILVANSTFLSSQIDIFGLVLAVEQSRLVALGKIAVAILSLIFILHQALVLFELVKSEVEIWFSDWDTMAKKEVEYLHLEIASQPPDLSYEPPQEEFEKSYYKMRKKKNSVRAALLLSADLLRGLALFVLNYGVLMVFVATSLFKPQLLSVLVEYVAALQTSEP